MYPHEESSRRSRTVRVSETGVGRNTHVSALPRRLLPAACLQLAYGLPGKSTSLRVECLVRGEVITSGVALASSFTGTFCAQRLRAFSAMNGGIGEGVDLLADELGCPALHSRNAFDKWRRLRGGRQNGRHGAATWFSTPLERWYLQRSRPAYEGAVRPVPAQLGARRHTDGAGLLSDDRVVRKPCHCGAGCAR